MISIERVNELSEIIHRTISHIGTRPRNRYYTIDPYGILGRENQVVADKVEWMSEWTRDSMFDLTYMRPNDFYGSVYGLSWKTRSLKEFTEDSYYEKKIRSRRH